jgi:glycosyltransferase involved in cell wall biosynthesis
VRRLGKLLVLNDQVLQREGETFGCSDAYTRFILGFLPHCEELVLASRVAAERPGPYLLPQDGRVRVAPLPHYGGIKDLYVRAHKYWQTIRAVLDREVPRADSLWLNYGHPVSLVALRRSEAGQRSFALMRGNYVKDARLRNPGPSGRLAAGLVRLNQARFARLAQRRGTQLFGVGREALQQLERRHGAAREVIPIMIPREELDDLAGGRSRSERVGRIRLLFVGRVEPEKDLDTLLDALRRARTHGMDIHLDVAGDGSERARLEALADGAGLAPHVTWHGHVTHGPALYALYRCADALVISSRTEGLPAALVEAGLFELPTVTTDVGGIGALVENGVSGVIVPPGDAEALARGFIRLAESPRIRRTMGERARALIGRRSLEGEVERMVTALTGASYRSGAG